VAVAVWRRPKRPKVFFEEWDDPLISGMEWVFELIEIAGAPTSSHRQRCVSSTLREVR
jgi:iron complex transport system substrate-binding protein